LIFGTSRAIVLARSRSIRGLECRSEVVGVRRSTTGCLAGSAFVQGRRSQSEPDLALSDLMGEWWAG
jgi:hypothetical protein